MGETKWLELRVALVVLELDVLNGEELLVLLGLLIAGLSPVGLHTVGAKCSTNQSEQLPHLGHRQLQILLDDVNFLVAQNFGASLCDMFAEVDNQRMGSTTKLLQEDFTCPFPLEVLSNHHVQNLIIQRQNVANESGFVAHTLIVLNPLTS